MDDILQFEILTHGVIVLIAGSIFGIYLLSRVFKGSEYFFADNTMLPKWFLIVFGIILQVPLAIYLILWCFGRTLRFKLFH